MTYIYIMVAMMFGFAVVAFLVILGFRYGLIRFGGREDHRPAVPFNPSPYTYAFPNNNLQMCPSTCVEHGTERERSLRNQENIDKLWLELKGLRQEMGQKIDTGFQTMLRGQTQLLTIFADAGMVPKASITRFMNGD